MIRKSWLIAAVLFAPGRFGQAAAQQVQAPQFTADGQLVAPKNYREWTFLSSGLGMTYGPISGAGATEDNPRFENVFVNPPAYRSFLKTGMWPEDTIFVLEIRSSASQVSINKNGRVQTDVAGAEAEVKNSQRFPGKWAFFDLSGEVRTAKPIPTAASCYSCHGQNGAVDNTFVQFYPTLIETARRMGTFHEQAAAIHSASLKSYVFHGKVEALNAAEASVRVNGDKVEGWMDAMTMNYKIDDPRVLKNIQPGDSITATVYDEDMVLHNVQVIAKHVNIK